MRRTTRPQIDPNRLAQFVKLSSALTGFPQDVIDPPLDPADPPLKQVYLARADGDSAQTVTDLLAAFAKLQGQPLQQIANALLEVGSQQPPSATALMARSILKLWYLGSWYAPASTDASNGSVVSMSGYVGGLAWTTAQAHPMGYSELKFGYWKDPPTEPFDVRGSQENNNG